MARPITIVETREFERQAAAIFALDELDALKAHLAFAPTAGAVIPGTGGIRKLRWGAGGKGRRGGARVIYYVHDDRMPLFLLTAYAKSRRDDLSPADRDNLRRLVAVLVETYRQGARNV
jgi:hypothetical protein